jgi:hypothetical protein
MTNLNAIKMKGRSEFPRGAAAELLENKSDRNQDRGWDEDLK